MSTYQFAEIVGNLSIVLGIVMMVFAFLLPKGWKSPLGLLILAFGGCVVAASLVHTPEGQTYARAIVAQAFSAY
jgi:hypothetical protein